MRSSKISCAIALDCSDDTIRTFIHAIWTGKGHLIPPSSCAQVSTRSLAAVVPVATTTAVTVTPKAYGVLK